MYRSPVGSSRANWMIQFPTSLIGGRLLCLRLLGAEDEIRNASVVGAAGVQVGSGFGKRDDDGFFDGAVGAFDVVGPIAAKPGGLDFLVEFVAVKLCGRAV